MDIYECNQIRRLEQEIDDWLNDIVSRLQKCPRPPTHLEVVTSRRLCYQVVYQIYAFDQTIIRPSETQRMMIYNRMINGIMQRGYKMHDLHEPTMCLYEIYKVTQAQSRDKRRVNKESDGPSTWLSAFFDNIPNEFPAKVKPKPWIQNWNAENLSFGPEVQKSLEVAKQETSSVLPRQENYTTSLLEKLLPDLRLAVLSSNPKPETNEAKPVQIGLEEHTTELLERLVTDPKPATSSSASKSREKEVIPVQARSEEHTTALLKILKEPKPSAPSSDLKPGAKKTTPVPPESEMQIVDPLEITEQPEPKPKPKPGASPSNPEAIVNEDTPILPTSTKDTADLLDEPLQKSKPTAAASEVSNRKSFAEVTTSDPKSIAKEASSYQKSMIKETTAIPPVLEKHAVDISMNNPPRKSKPELCSRNQKSKTKEATSTPKSKEREVTTIPPNSEKHTADLLVKQASSSNPSSMANDASLHPKPIANEATPLQTRPRKRAGNRRGRLPKDPKPGVSASNWRSPTKDASSTSMPISKEVVPKPPRPENYTKNLLDIPLKDSKPGAAFWKSKSVAKERTPINTSPIPPRAARRTSGNVELESKMTSPNSKSVTKKQIIVNDRAISSNTGHESSTSIEPRPKINPTNPMSASRENKSVVALPILSKPAQELSVITEVEAKSTSTNTKPSTTPDTLAKNPEPGQERYNPASSDPQTKKIAQEAVEVKTKEAKRESLKPMPDAVLGPGLFAAESTIDMIRPSSELETKTRAGPTSLQPRAELLVDRSEIEAFFDLLKVKQQNGRAIRDEYYDEMVGDLLKSWQSISDTCDVAAINSGAHIMSSIVIQEVAKRDIRRDFVLREIAAVCNRAQKQNLAAMLIREEKKTQSFASDEEKATYEEGCRIAERKALFFQIFREELLSTLNSNLFHVEKGG